MLILFDQGVPVPLRRHLCGHHVETAYQRQWSQHSNGDLLATAEAAGFELLVTTDQNLKYQQNLSERRIRILVLKVASWPSIEPHATSIAKVIGSMESGDYLEWKPS